MSKPPASAPSERYPDIPGVPCSHTIRCEPPAPAPAPSERCACGFNRDGKRIHECQECAAKRLGYLTPETAIIAPAPSERAAYLASERCGSCGLYVSNTIHDYAAEGHHSFVRVFTGAEVRKMSERTFNEIAALRADVERLHAGDEQRVRDLVKHMQRADAAEAEVERLTKALAEQPKCVYKCDNCEEISNG